MNSPALAPDALPVLDDPLEQRRFTRFAGSADAAVAESSLQLSGMHCAACAGTIEAALGTLDGVVGVQVNAASQRALVRWLPARTRASALVAALRRAGYDAVPDTAAEARRLRIAEDRKLLWRLFVAAFCAMQVMMLATPAYVAAPGELSDDLRQLLDRVAFALASSPGLVIGPLMLRRLGGRAHASAVVAVAWPVRLAGLALSAGSAWALGHGLWQRVAAWCTG